MKLIPSSGQVEAEVEVDVMGKGKNAHGSI